MTTPDNPTGDDTVPAADPAETAGNDAPASGEGHVFITQEAAAAACGKSYDTIRRYRRFNKLPHSKTRDDGVIEVSVTDLVAAGLLDPLATADVHDVVNRSRAERENANLRRDLAVATAQVELLNERLTQSADEIAFLRRLLHKDVA